MVKLTVLYGYPTDPDAFESYYAETHMPLARAIPNLERIEAGKVVANPAGGELPYYRIAELWFADMQTLQEAMGSEQGKATGADVANFATGGATMFISESD
jgi:uncharacterized protein (TIGR02118 family)